MTTQPPGHWLQIADTALQSQGSSLLQSAQLTALLGDGENDAGIAVWGLKYHYNLWRPITALNASCTVTQDASGKVIARTVSWSQAFTTCDPGWSSLILTPPHPDYVAGHPAFSGAGATILADFFGTDAMSFTSSSDYLLQYRGRQLQFRWKPEVLHARRATPTRSATPATAPSSPLASSATTAR